MVVFIIGILATMFTLSVGAVGGADREMHREAERLEQLIALALEDASFQTRELGIRFYPGRYEFSVRKAPDVLPADATNTAQNGMGADGTGPPARKDPKDKEVAEKEEWTVIPAAEVLGGRKLPEAFLLELEVGGRVVNLERSEKDVEKRYEPQVFILSSGEINDDFVVHVRDRQEDRGYTLSVAQDGTATLKRDGG